MMTEEEIFEGDDVYYVDKEGKKATRIWYWTNEGWRFFGSNGAAYDGMATPILFCAMSNSGS